MSLAYYEANVGNENSKSLNAAEAEAAGRWPRTVAAKKLGISTKAFDAGCHVAKYTVSEWHHTGSHARRTDYYDTVALAADANFWRGAANKYAPNRGAALLAAHNVSAWTDAEKNEARQKSIGTALENVRRFLASYGDKFVVQQSFMGKGFDKKLHPNSAMSDLGLLSGYDYRECGLQVFDLETATKKATDNTAWRAQQAKDPNSCQFGKPATEYRVVSVREELRECAIYASYCGKFERVGIFGDFEK